MFYQILPNSIKIYQLESVDISIIYRIFLWQKEINAVKSMLFAHNLILSRKLFPMV